MLVGENSAPDELVMSPGKAVAGGNSEADGPILWLVIKSVEEASGLEGPTTVDRALLGTMGEGVKGAS